MAETVEFYETGGIDSRSNPLNFPSVRALRCKNWTKDAAGYLKLRHGATKPAMTSVAASEIHSAFLFEKYDNTRYVLFGQGTSLKRLEVGSTGTVTSLATLSAASGFEAFFANNQLFIANGVDFKVYDGATLRDVGIRAPTSAETSSVTVVESTGSTGSWSTTQFTGYQFFMSYYNPTSGHVGNRSAIASRRTIAGTESVVVVSNLPNLAAVNSEWVKLIGRTPDNGQVPYALVGSTGDWIVVGNTATVATLTLPDIDTESELPERNDIPQAMSKACYASGRWYGILQSDPHRIVYSEAEWDDTQGLFVGRPEQCGPANNATLFPTGEGGRAIHGVYGDAWVWSRHHLAILTELGRYSAGGNAYPDWAGTWVGGIAGQRAFVMTEHGPFWVSAEKQLMTMTESGPTVVSTEYERGLLTRIADAQVQNTELAYHRDTLRGIDRLYVKGKDTNGDPVIAVHDFAHRSPRSPMGEGYEYQYEGFTISIFVRNPLPVVSLVDQNGARRAWAGASNGRFYQLEDGLDDDGTAYSADYIGMMKLGSRRTMIGGLRWHGDANLRVSWSTRLNQTLTQFDAVIPAEVETVEKDEALCRVPIEESGKFFLYRIQLDSHAGQGDTLDLNDPPHVPLETYGRVYVMEPEIGAGRDEGGARP